jgi:hypothetical protein
MSSTSGTSAVTENKSAAAVVPTSNTQPGTAAPENGFHTAPEWAAKIQRVLFSEDVIQKRCLHIH